MKTPKIVGRKYKPFDWFAWAMSILGILLICKNGGIGWIFGTDKNWWLLAAVVFIFIEYPIRIAYGRVYKFVYFDTIIHKLYKIDISGKEFFVCAENENELDLYLESTYPNLKYKIMDETIVESFIKEEKYS